MSERIVKLWNRMPRAVVKPQGGSKGAGRENRTAGGEECRKLKEGQKDRSSDGQELGWGMSKLGVGWRQVKPHTQHSQAGLEQGELGDVS